MAQWPGNIRIRIGGRGFNFRGNIPAAALAEMFKPGKLKFQESVLRGDVARASRYVKQQFVNEPIKGYPPLFYAAIHGNTPMVRMLMHNGASVKRRYQGGSIAYIAASNGHPGTARYLVDQGGGKTEDIAQGRALYAENSERQRKQTQALTVLALGVVVAALAASSDSGYSTSSPSESYDFDRDRQNENYKAEQKGEPLPYPGVSAIQH